jgi:hypothetical protein
MNTLERTAELQRLHEGVMLGMAENDHECRQSSQDLNGNDLFHRARPRQRHDAGRSG